MNGLLDFVKTPEGQGLLAAVAGGFANARRGAPLNTLGAAGLSGLTGYARAQDRQQQAAESDQLKNMRQFQMDELVRQRAETEKLRGLAQSSVLSPEQQAIGKFGPTAQGAQSIQSFKPKFDMDGYLNGLMAIDPMKAMTLKQSLAPKPVKLGEGEQLLDPTTFKPIAQGLPKADSVPSAVKEYEYAQKQGYKGSFQQFQLDGKRAGAATTQIITPKDVINYERDARKDFEGMDPVKTYRAAYPAFAAVKDAASRNTPQSDINLVYGIAKLYDPNSVVREGEYNTIANSQAIPERLKGMAQHLAGGGKLTAETKSQLLKEAEGRISAFENEYMKTYKTYSGMVERNKLNPQNIFTEVGRIGANGQMIEQAQPATDLTSAAAAELARRGKK